MALVHEFQSINGADICSWCGCFRNSKVHSQNFVVDRELLADVVDDIKDEVNFIVKDSGKRQQFESGMVRDTREGKTDYTSILDGPMLTRWAEHLTKAKVKYPDIRPGVANWTLAAGEEELNHFKKSAFGHFIKWIRGDRDEDHAAALYFNVNGYEFVREKLNAKSQ